MEQLVDIAVPKTRADFLVSVAVVVVSYDEREVGAIKSLSLTLAQSFRFWEIVVVVPISHTVTTPLVDALAHSPNVRLLRVDDTDNFYRLRLAAVSEAIGDVVLLTSGEEIAYMDLPALANRVYEGNAPIVMTREPRLGLPPVFFGSLGYLTGYRIDSHDTLTAGFPRSWLSVVLARPDAELLLRFETRSAGSRFRREFVPGHKRLPRSLRSTGRRFRLLADLMASSAPRVLRAVSAMSFVLTLIAVVYGFYAIGVWLLKPDIAPGWLTTSLLQVITAGFLGVAVSSISIGIVKLFDRIEGILRYTIVDESSNVDLFNEVKDLNVVVNRDWRQPMEIH